MEGAPHRRSATGLPEPDLSREGVQAAILGRSASGGNQRTDRPPIDLLHQRRPNEPTEHSSFGRAAYAIAFPSDWNMTSPHVEITDVVAYVPYQPCPRRGTNEVFLAGD